MAPGKWGLSLFSRPHLAVAQDLLQHVAELRRVLVAVRLHPVLHRRLEQLLLRIGRHRERAVDVAREFPAVDVLACHGGTLLEVETDESSSVLSARGWE